jgi:hypothetical protein
MQTAIKFLENTQGHITLAFCFFAISHHLRMDFFLYYSQVTQNQKLKQHNIFLTSRHILEIISDNRHL